MGTKWASIAVLDGGTDGIRAVAATVARVKMHLVKAYAANDTYATVIANSCGSVDLVPGDLVQSGAAGAARATTVAAKSIALTANSGVAPNLQVVIVDSTGTAVLLVNDETSDQQVYSGGTFNVPAWTYTIGQPT